MTTVSVIGVVVALIFSLALVLNTRPATGIPEIGAAQYLAESGHREFLSSGPTTTIVENSQLPGAVAFSDASPTIQQVLASVGVDQAADSFWVSELLDMPTGLFTRFLGMDDTGLVLYAFGMPDSQTRFDSGLIELPADPRPGTTWTSQTTAINPDGTEEEWTRQGSIAQSSEPGCLDVSIVDQQPASGVTTSTFTRCEQRGIVAIDDQHATAPPAPDMSELSLTPHSDLLPSVDPLPVSIVADGVALSVGMTTGPVAVGDGFVYANRTNGQLVFVRPDPSGEWTIDATRRPGADVTTLLGSGEVVVAATTDRTLVAYSAAGKWLWQSEISDLASDLVRVSDRSAAALTLDGKLVVVDLTDGAVVREAEMPSGSLVAPAVGADTGAGPVVITAAERKLVILNADDTTTPIEVRDEVSSMALADGVIVVSDVSADLSGFDLKGNRLWRAGLAASCRQLLLSGQTVYCRLPDTVAAIDALSGRILWQADYTALMIYFAADRLLVLGRQTTTMLASDGQQLASWPIERTAPNTWAVSMKSGLLTVSDTGQFEWWQA